MFPFSNLFKKKVPTEYFLALLFRDEKIHAVVFEQESGHIQVVGEGKAALAGSLERVSDEMLLDAADRAISIAEEPLPNGIQTHKTVFGVKETWVEDARITKDHLSRLKTISDQLDLKPIGFLVFPEAIAHLLQKEEGAPVSAILVEAGKKQATITLLRAGRIIGTKEVSLLDSVTQTVETALQQFENIEILPSRIILFDTDDNSLEKTFLSHKWSKSLPFLHVPQITTLPGDFDTRAILFGTATQMGFDAIDVVKQPIKTRGAVSFEELEPGKGELSNETPVKEVAEEKKEKAQPAETTTAKEETTDQEVTGADTSEYFGFVKDEDVAEGVSHPHETPLPTHQAINEVTEEIPEEEKEEELAGSAFGFSAAGPLFFEGAKKILTYSKRFVPSAISAAPFAKAAQQATTMLPGGGKKILLLIPAAVLIAVIAFLWFVFGVHAKVTITLTPKIVSQDQSITFTTTGGTDPSKNVIAAQTLSVSEEGKVSGNATGTKDVGNKAKGTVTVFNIDDSSHTITAGTTITSSNGLKFTLDKDVTVASGSSDPINPTSGTADVSITASDIGTDYNLPSNTKFTFSGTSVLAAKNANAFSGGTKKSITIVSQKDVDTLIAQLTSNLKDKAKNDLSAKVDSATVVLPDFTDTKAVDTSVDKKVGDEAQSINLDGTISYQTIAYKKADIESYTKSALNGKLPQDLSLAPNGISYTVKDMVTKDGTTKVTLTMQAALIPKLDVKSLQNQIAGKSFAAARDILSQIPQFSDSTFTLSPNVFFLPRVLPRLGNNITITVDSHD